MLLYSIFNPRRRRATLWSTERNNHKKCTELGNSEKMPFATPFNHYNNKYVYMDFFFSLLPIYAPMGMLSVELFFFSRSSSTSDCSVLSLPSYLTPSSSSFSLLNYNAFLSNSLYSEVEMNVFFSAPFASLLPSYSAATE